MNRIDQGSGRRKAQLEQVVQCQPIPPSSPQASSLSLVLAHWSPSSRTTMPVRPPIIPYLTPNSPSSIPGPITFPLTPDHLITLIQFNVLRATLTNMAILSILHTVPLECGNVFAIPFPAGPTTVPPSLEPTPLQKCTPHEPWIDTLPLGQMRDNMILMVGSYDNDDLCDDMIGGLFEGYNDCKLGLNIISHF
jgi:hypothetical protein